MKSKRSNPNREDPVALGFSAEQNSLGRIYSYICYHHLRQNPRTFTEMTIIPLLIGSGVGCCKGRHGLSAHDNKILEAQLLNIKLI